MLRRVQRGQWRGFLFFLLRIRIGCRRGEQVALRRGVQRLRFQARQVLARGLDHGLRHAGQLRHLQTVALRGGTGLHGVQEDDAVLVFDGGQMHVGGARMAIRQLRQLKVVRGKQGEAAAAVDQMARDGPRQGQAVEGRGAAAHFIHQHQRVFGGAVQNGGRFRHFHHEGRASARQVVGGANAREDAVDGADGGGRGRHVAAHVG